MRWHDGNCIDCIVWCYGFVAFVTCFFSFWEVAAWLKVLPICHWECWTRSWANSAECRTCILAKKQQENVSVNESSEESFCFTKLGFSWKNWLTTLILDPSWALRWLPLLMLLVLLLMGYPSLIHHCFTNCPFSHSSLNHTFSPLFSF